MGGELTVHSDGVGLGATFTLVLPNRAAANHVASKARHPEAEIETEDEGSHSLAAAP
jgi:hypothetical protein